MNFTKQLEEKYPIDVIRFLRQREGLAEDDGSLDKKFLYLKQSEVFKEVLAWNGLLGGWDSIIKEWIKGIYKIDLDSLSSR